ncbi:MAG: hypothetical protein AAFR88_09710 [Pseudomonadota bacterium]
MPEAIPSPGAGETVLALDTIITRPVIEVDGKRHEIVSLDELSIVELQRLTRWVDRIEALVKVDTEEAEDEFKQLIELASAMICAPMPKAVFAKLSGAHRWQVIEAFTVLLLRSKMSAAGAMQSAIAAMMPEGGAALGPADGMPLSPGSSAPSAGTGGSGFMKRLWFWLTAT